MPDNSPLAPDRQSALQNQITVMRLAGRDFVVDRLAHQAEHLDIIMRNQPGIDRDVLAKATQAMVPKKTIIKIKAEHVMSWDHTTSLTKECIDVTEVVCWAC